MEYIHIHKKHIIEYATEPAPTANNLFSVLDDVCLEVWGESYRKANGTHSYKFDKAKFEEYIEYLENSNVYCSFISERNLSNKDFAKIFREWLSQADADNPFVFIDVSFKEDI